MLFRNLSLLNFGINKITSMCHKFWMIFVSFTIYVWFVAENIISYFDSYMIEGHSIVSLVSNSLVNTIRGQVERDNKNNKDINALQVVMCGKKLQFKCCLCTDQTKKAIIWTNVGIVYWCGNGLHGFDELHFYSLALSAGGVLLLYCFGWENRCLVPAFVGPLSPKSLDGFCSLKV